MVLLTSGSQQDKEGLLRRIKIIGASITRRIWELRLQSASGAEMCEQ